MKPSPLIGISYRTSYHHLHNSNTSLHSAMSKDIRMVKAHTPNFPYQHNSMLTPITSPRDIKLCQNFNSTSFQPSQAVMHMCPYWETLSCQSSHWNCDRQHHWHHYRNTSWINTTGQHPSTTTSIGQHITHPSKNPPCPINSLSNSFMGGYQSGT